MSAGFLPTCACESGYPWLVLNFVFWSFEFVSDFDIRISDFNHSGCFIQNKPNLLDTQMNVSSFLTKDYENKSNWKLGENKPNSKPIKANTKPKQSQNKANLLDAQMNISSVITKDYKNKPHLRTPPKQTQTNPIFPKISIFSVSNFVFWSFEFVSNFDIRISYFTFSSPHSPQQKILVATAGWYYKDSGQVIDSCSFDCAQDKLCRNDNTKHYWTK